ncbi:hypothetical protein GCM10020254_10100 [Streptomyces goshikiensis]
MRDASGAFLAGQTGLIVTIPEAEPVVRAWRERLDPGARAGVPAHVTVLFPFLEERDIDASVHAAIAEVLAGHEAFDLRFEGVRALPRDPLPRPPSRTPRCAGSPSRSPSAGRETRRTAAGSPRSSRTSRSRRTRNPMSCRRSRPTSGPASPSRPTSRPSR